MRRLQTKFVADISRYTQNFVLGMSPRQTAAALAGGALMTAGPLLWPAGEVFTFAAGFLLIMAGFLRPDGLPLEKYLAAWISSHLLRPPRRHYEPDNVIMDFLWDGKIGGRVRFRPADYLREETKMQNATEEQLSVPETEGEESAPSGKVPEAPPENPAPPAPKKAASKKGKTAPKSRRKVTMPVIPPEDAWLKPRPKPRVPRYGTGTAKGDRP